MLPSWPSELPRPNRSDYSLSLGENRRFSQGDQGPPRPRRGWAKPTKIVNMSITVDRNLLARFERFREGEVGIAALPFLMPDPGTDGWGLATADGVPLTTEIGTPILLVSTWVCLFGQSVPAVTPVGVEWKISFDVMVLPQ